jgi:5-formyltetrahydrofolate cyclo-ligase
LFQYYYSKSVKDSLRKQVAETRNKLTAEERRTKSRDIENRLFQLPEFNGSSLILFFASFRSEVNTIPMIRRALAEGKRVALPKVKGNGLELFEIREFEKDVSPGAWGIPEPHEHNRVALDAVDLLIVPGLAFDEWGNRLGYGAGFYDKLLASCTNPTVALAFEGQIVSEVPAGSHDIRIKKIVTEKRVIEADKC